MMYRSGYLLSLLFVGACSHQAMPVEVPANQHPRPDWTSQLTMQVDAMSACLELLETPRYVVFLDSLPSGATGVTTLDAYGNIAHCAWLGGEVVRREPTPLGAKDIADAGGVLFSLGPTRPVVPEGIALEEVFEDGAVVGFLAWPKAPEAPQEKKRSDVEG